MINKIVIKFIGKLYILFSIKEFSINKDFNSIIFMFSKFWILLKNISFCLNKYIKIIKIKINKVFKNINKKLILKLNCSFEAIEVMYINKISIPPKKIKKRE